MYFPNSYSTLSMKKILSYFFLLILFIAQMSGEVRRLRFHYLSTENGLPRNSACSITEDKYGFIWIATIDGLCRFDGYKVKIYSSIPGNSKSPVNNRPKKLIRDRQGNIWSSFSSDSRFCRYNYLSDDFRIRKRLFRIISKHFLINRITLQERQKTANFNGM